MRTLSLIWRIAIAVSLSIASVPVFSEAARAEGNLTVLNFAVMRNGEQIGTSTIRLHRDGQRTVAELVTQVQVKIASITVYRLDQRETEHWIDGKLVAMNSVTDDNGTLHKVSATKRGNTLSVNANGKISEIDSAVIPASLWNASLVRTTMALNSRDGSVMPISVIDHGKKQLVLHGRATTAHHYSIKTDFRQDVWYDEQHRLVRVELRGSDGSKIQYQPG